MAPMYGGFVDDFEGNIEGLIRERQLNRGVFDVERDELGIFRSGSAPPTVEGSRRAFGNLLGHEISSVGARHVRSFVSEDDEMRAHPDYLWYYYSSGNFNPRMPPPSLSKEDWRARQRAGFFGKIGDRRMDDSLNIDENSSSLFSSQPGFLRDGKEFDLVEMNREVMRNRSGEWLDRRSDGDVGIGGRRKSFADVLQQQEEIGLQTCDNFDMARASDYQVRQSRISFEGLGSLQYGSTSSNHARVQSLGSSFSHSFAPGLSSSVSRSVIPDPQLVRRSPSPHLPPIGARNIDNGSYNIAGSNDLGSFHMGDCNDLTTGMSGLSLSKNIIKDEENHVQHGLDELSSQHGLFYDVPSDKRQLLPHNVMANSEFELLRSQSSNHLSEHADLSKKTDSLTSIGLTKLASNGQIHLPKQSSHSSTIKKVYPEDASSMGSNIHQSADLSSIDLCGSKLKPYGDFSELSATLTRQLETGQYMNLTENQVGSGFHLPSVDPLDPLYPQYLPGVSDSLLHRNLDSSSDRNFLSGSHVDYLNAYRGALLANEKHRYGIPLSKSVALNHGFYGSHSYGFGIPHPASSMPGVVRTHLASGSPIGQNKRISRTNSVIRGSGRESIGIWSLENEGSSLLEDFKSNKSSVSFELSDIVGHVVEFSEDQFGSRFIQQKLETASTEDKNKIFPEILPKAHSLMTDVFGNYVIQKYFEYGTEIQRKQLAEQLTGHVLQLSLQMYGCRVIQKALEVVDVDQKTQMVLELDGNIMKCVRDQNGNHVIQKCIECVPEEKIQFIIQAFYGHVVSLSTHPYGCRVIQRVLEHCNNPKIQSVMMNEILQAVCPLAQNQYGNYVIQHVLQHGKSEERTTIIKELTGQIVTMSQQKYASNVVEKCLTFGTAEERQLLIDEILGTTDENEPLQAMMTDQFGNYVVQKVLEKCDDHNRELILSRIKVHLNALKKYTYGKHIVARVEKLVAAGERRIGVSSYS